MQRHASLDMLRGLMLVLIMLGHLGGWPAALTWQPVGIVSAAEGFFFLSGLLFARVQMARAAPGLPGLIHPAWQRAWLLYRHVLLTCAVAMFAISVLGADMHEGLHLSALLREDPLRLLLLALGLCLNARWLDILPMYVVFLLLAPVVLHGFRRGWGGWLVAGSLLLWLSDQLPAAQGPLLLVPAGGIQGMFHLHAWQVVFVLGLTAGAAWQRGWQLPLRRHWLLLAGLVAGVGLLLRHATPLWHDPTWAPWLGRGHLGPWRLLNFLALAYLLFALGKQGWLPRLPWPARLGRHSLHVFTAHVLFLYLLAPWRPQLTSPLAELLLAAAMLLLAWAVAALGERPDGRATTARPTLAAR